jgi:hypothetical protein
MRKVSYFGVVDDIMEDFESLKEDLILRDSDEEENLLEDLLND